MSCWAPSGAPHAVRGAHRIQAKRDGMLLIYFLPRADRVPRGVAAELRAGARHPPTPGEYPLQRHLDDAEPGARQHVDAARAHRAVGLAAGDQALERTAKLA